MSKQYVVTAPYVVLTVPTTDGPQVRGFYAGAPVPDGVSEESLKHHLDNDLIAEQKDAEAALTAPAEPSDGLGTLTNPEQPKGNASLEEWTAYATASGMTADELEGLTRDQIRDRYVTP
jgi:hypothetical protein